MMKRKEVQIVSRSKNYEDKTTELIMPIVERMGFELVDVEFVKEGSTWYLRAYIDKEGGISVNDCEAVAREMNEILDREDYIEESYIFEVSSPGLGRPLKKEKDYVRNLNKMVEIRTYRMIERRKEFSGILKAYDKDTVSIVEDNNEIIFNKSDIALIREYIDF
jgi:ribosome maturation factor RimP